MASLAVGSTNLIELTGLQDTTDLSYPTTATVTADLFTAAGVAVTGATGLAMPLVAGTSGATAKYRAAVPASVSLTLYAQYTARVTVTDASGNVRLFYVPCSAVAG